MKAKRRLVVKKIPIYIALIIICLFAVGPFIWMVATSVKPDGEVLTAVPHLFPSKWQFGNYIAAWNAAPFGTFFINSFLISAIQTIFDLTFGAMAAYAFARIEFFGKRFLFILLLSTMMVPGEVLLVPNYITVSNWKWVDTYQGLIVPGLISIFSIFLMRQFFLSLPKEVFEAADLDGCHPLRTLFGIVMPISKPIWITAGILKFVGSWNSFLWVLIVANTPKHYTLPIGLMSFSSDVGTVYNQLMAAATFCVLPLMVVFLIGQRYFIEGIARTGIK
jgi:multiple sugar transport system permease protein